MEQPEPQRASKRKKPKFDPFLKKETARELARLMYEDIRKQNDLEEKSYRDKVWEEALANIKDHTFGTCQYCHKFVEYNGKEHREESINGKFFWIARCPECHRENYMNIWTFSKKFGDEVTWLVDYAWMTREKAYGLPEPQKPQDKGMGRIYVGFYRNK